MSLIDKMEYFGWVGYDLVKKLSVSCYYWSLLR